MVQALIYILPAYICNSSAALFGGGKSIDFGKTIRGKRILGKGKTIRGTASGIFFGTLTGALLATFTADFSLIILAFFLSLGAVLGDFAGSFLKRQVGVKSGQPVPILDQIDFLIGAVCLGMLIKPITLNQFCFLLIITPAAHLTVNFIGYLLKLKKVPW